MRSLTGLILFFLSVCCLSAREPLVLVSPGTDDAPSTQVLSNLVFELVKDLYDAVGVPVVLKTLPAQRTLDAVNSGDYDGELFRVAGMENDFQNLIRVPEPLMVVNIYAWGMKDQIHLYNLTELKRYRIGFIRGVKSADSLSKGARQFPVRRFSQLITMLKSGKIDLFLESDVRTRTYLELNRIDFIAPLEPPVQSALIYHYLHKRHAALVPLLTRELQKRRP